MTAAMDVVGAKFQTGELFVPEILVAARAMKAGMEILEPVLVSAGVRPEHRAVIGTVGGDLHDIGKNLVGMMWKGAGIEVIDLGVDVPAARFVDAARHNDAVTKANGCPVEFTLKDITTVRHEPGRLWEWAEIATRMVRG
jgi:5-methyltetrahydrofolate--homocysteine methyltransferase